MQPKRLRSDLKGLGSGAAGQWHQGDENFHVTIYPDDANHIVPRGFTYISDRWVSEFHVSKKAPHQFGRRFYDIDKGTKVGADQGRIDGHDGLAAAFMNGVVSKTKEYTDLEAQDLERVKNEEAAKAGAQQMAGVQAVVEKHAKTYVGREIDWKDVKSFLIFGKIRNELQEERIEVPTTLIQEEFDRALSKLNADALRAKEQSDLLSNDLDEKSDGKVVVEERTLDRAESQVSSYTSAIKDPIVVSILILLLALAWMFLF